VALRYVPESELARLQALDAVLGTGVAAIKLAVEDGRCGTNDEVLRAHRLDAESIAERVGAAVGVPA
jgi:hypothetical protein